MFVFVRTPCATYVNVDHVVSIELLGIPDDRKKIGIEHHVDIRYSNGVVQSAVMLWSDIRKLTGQELERDRLKLVETKPKANAE